MSYEYSFDETSAGIRSFPRHTYELLQEGLGQLVTALESTNREAVEQGLDEPFARELGDVRLMIQWGEEKLGEAGRSGFEVFVGQVSVGSLRYLAAAALLMLHEVQAKREAGRAKGLPKPAFRTLDRKLNLLKQVIVGMAVEPPEFLREIAPYTAAEVAASEEEEEEGPTPAPRDAHRLRRIVERLETALARGREGILRPGELVAAEQEAKVALDQLLPRDSDSWRHGDKLRRRTTWRDETLDGYASPDNCEQILGPWGTFYGGLADLVGVTTAKADVAIRAGEQVKALRHIQAIMGRAHRLLQVVDPYVDGVLIELVSDLPTNVELQVLTRGRNVKLSFWPLVRASRAEGRTISVRHDDSHHDRFIVVDEDEVWHLGASIKDIGRKASRISRFNSHTQEAEALKAIETAWKSSDPLDSGQSRRQPSSPTPE